MMESIKLLRFSSGEDVIASIYPSSDDSIVTVHDPMTVFYKKLGNRKIVMVETWLPNELLETNVAAVNIRDIIAMMQPSETFIEYYKGCVELLHSKEDDSESNLSSNNDSSLSEEAGKIILEAWEPDIPKEQLN